MPANLSKLLNNKKLMYGLAGGIAGGLGGLTANAAMSDVDEPLVGKRGSLAAIAGAITGAGLGSTGGYIQQKMINRDVMRAGIRKKDAIKRTASEARSGRLSGIRDVIQEFDAEKKFRFRKGKEPLKAMGKPRMRAWIQDEQFKKILNMPEKQQIDAVKNLSPRDSRSFYDYMKRQLGEV